MDKAKLFRELATKILANIPERSTDPDSFFYDMFPDDEVPQKYKISLPKQDEGTSTSGKGTDLPKVKQQQRGIDLATNRALPNSSDNSHRVAMREPTQPTAQSPIPLIRHSSGSPKHRKCNVFVPGQPITPKEILERGHLAPSDQSFCLIDSLSKFPYIKFIPEAHSESVADAFFNSGKFWERSWHLYYLHSSQSQKPLILIAEGQFNELLKQIDDQFPFLDVLSDESMQTFRDRDLLLDFPDHPRYTPRYLGLSQTKQQYESLASALPVENFRMPNEDDHPPLNVEDEKNFNLMVDDALGLTKKRNKEKRDRARDITKELLNSMFKRAQRYLGLRNIITEAPPDPCTNPTLKTDEERFAVAQLRATLLETPRIDVNKAAPYPFYKNPVIIAIDVEAWELDHSCITEVGLAILDTNKLVEVPPGPMGQNWFAYIEARHFLMLEYQHIVNSKFVKGNPYGFKFGETETVSLGHIGILVKDILEGFHAMGRSIVPIGHNIQADIGFLNQLDIRITEHPAVLETIDTQWLWRALNNNSTSANNTSLARVCVVLDLDCTGWHNAGNDAVYTMHTLLGMAVVEGTMRP